MTSSPELLGFLAGALTTASFIPQVLKTWRSRSTEDISLGMFSLFCAGLVLWTAYGAMLRSLPIVLWNSITLILAGTILIFKLRYK